MTLNQCQFIGNLGADPEMRTASSGLTIARLRLGVNERVKRGDEWVDHTEWISITCFGKTAESVERYCRKGKQLFVSGRMRTSKYQDKDGNDRWSTEVTADQVRFLGSRDDGDSGGGDRNDRGRGDGRGGSSGGGERGQDGRGRDEGRGDSRGRGDDRGRGGSSGGGNRDEGRGGGGRNDGGGGRGGDDEIPF